MIICPRTHAIGSDLASDSLPRNVSHHDVKIPMIHPMTVRIVTKYTGGTDNKIAKKILDGVNDGGSVLLELHPSYYSTWDHSTA